MEKENRGGGGGGIKKRGKKRKRKKRTHSEMGGELEGSIARRDLQAARARCGAVGGQWGGLVARAWCGAVGWVSGQGLVRCCGVG